MGLMKRMPAAPTVWGHTLCCSGLYVGFTSTCQSLALYETAENRRAESEGLEEVRNIPQSIR